MTTTLHVRPQISELVMTVRFVQGYRFLDSCGEAVIQLENTLEEGWLPGELAPTGGTMRNYALGLATTFDSGQLTVQQSEFIDFGIFSDQTAKIYETLWRLLRINEVLSPAFRIVFQAGFENSQLADLYIQKLGYVMPAPRIAADLGGELRVLHCVVCTEEATRRYDHDLTVRRRLAVRSMTQTKQPDFDSRVMQRVSLLSTKHQAAVRGLLELRRKHVASVTDGAEISYEESLTGEDPEIETRSFSIREFLESTWSQAQKLLPTYEMKFDVP